MALNEYLFDSVGMYVYSRTKLKEFEDKKKARSIGAKALRLMKANGNPDEKGTGNELGEMLLFTFMEGSLHAPKLLSKVEITTDASQFKSKSDCVHLLKRKVNGKISYQLVLVLPAYQEESKTLLTVHLMLCLQLRTDAEKSDKWLIARF